MNVEFFLSLRYFLAKKRRSSISLISAISVSCVALAVIVLIVVFSVLNGFHETMKGKILSVDSHIQVTPQAGGTIARYREAQAAIQRARGVTVALPYYEGQGLLRAHGASSGIKVRGVPADILERDKDFASKMTLLAGKFDLARRNNVVLGEVLAQILGVQVGDYVSIYVPPRQADDLLLPLSLQYRVAGIFTVGHADFDQFFAFLSLPDAQYLFGEGDVATAIGVKVADPEQAHIVKQSIDRETQFGYTSMTWMQLRRNLYQALVTEKALIGVVCLFLILMAGFAIASTLIMVVMEKEREIGILKSMGMTPASTTRVFVTQGLFIGLAGALLGLFVGLLIASSMTELLKLVEDVFNGFSSAYHALFGKLFDLPQPYPWKLFPQDVYYMTSFQVKIVPLEVLVITIVSVILTTLCAFIPARQAARLRITETIHKD